MRRPSAPRRARCALTPTPTLTLTLTLALTLTLTLTFTLTLTLTLTLTPTLTLALPRCARERGGGGPRGASTGRVGRLSPPLHSGKRRWKNE